MPGRAALTLAGKYPIAKVSPNMTGAKVPRGAGAIVIWENFETGLPVVDWTATARASASATTLPFNARFYDTWNDGNEPVNTTGEGYGGGWGMLSPDDDFYSYVFIEFPDRMSLPQWTIGVEVMADHASLVGAPDYGGAYHIGFSSTTPVTSWGRGQYPYGEVQLSVGGDVDYDNSDPNNAKRDMTVIQLTADYTDTTFLDWQVGGAFNVIQPGTWQKVRVELGFSSDEGTVWAARRDGWYRVYVDDVLVMAQDRTVLWLDNQYDRENGVNTPPKIGHILLGPVGRMDNVTVYFPSNPGFGDKTMEIPRAALTLTGWALPEQHPVRSPGVASLILTRHLAEAFESRFVQPPVAALAVTGYAPELHDFLYPLDRGVLTFTTYAPGSWIYSPVAGPTTCWFNTIDPEYTPPTYKGAWDQNGQVFTGSLYGERVSSQDVIQNVQKQTSVAAGWDVLLARFVSGRVQGHTIAGTVDAALFGLQYALDGGGQLIDWTLDTSLASLHVHIYVTKGDTDEVRGTLLSDLRMTAVRWRHGNDGWPAWGYWSYAYGLGSASLTSVECWQGDRIVVEIGAVLDHTSGPDAYVGTYLHANITYPTVAVVTDALAGTGTAGITRNAFATYVRIPSLTFSQGISWLPSDYVDCAQIVVETLTQKAIAEVQTSQMLAEVLSAPPFIWLDVPNFLTEHLLSSDYTSGQAWVRADIWAADADVEVACRLFNWTDRVQVGISATIMTTVPVEVEFPVQLTTGLKEYRLQVGTRTYGADVFGIGQLVRTGSLMPPVVPNPPPPPPPLPQVPPTPPPSNDLIYDANIASPNSFGCFHLMGQGGFLMYRWVYVSALIGNHVSNVMFAGDLHGDVDPNTAVRVNFGAVPGATAYRVYVFNTREGGGDLWNPYLRPDNPVSDDPGPAVMRWKEYVPGSSSSFARPWGGWPTYTGTTPDYELDFYSDADGTAWVKGQ
jgi:hypothetical protein